jgi:2'-5' RNA ligase
MAAVDKQRLFFALWPTPAVRERLAALTSDLPRRAGFRVPAANLHITLVFLGGVDPETSQRVLAAAGDATGRTFRLRLDHSGYWPRPRVAWVGPHKVPPALAGLQGALCAALERAGVAYDRRPFVPHVTVARDARAPLGLAPDRPIHWTVDAYALVESVTHPGGARYTVLQTWPLRRR